MRSKHNTLRAKRRNSTSQRSALRGYRYARNAYDPFADDMPDYLFACGNSDTPQA